MPPAMKALSSQGQRRNGAVMGISKNKREHLTKAYPTVVDMAPSSPSTRRWLSIASLRIYKWEKLGRFKVPKGSESSGERAYLNIDHSKEARNKR
jgi:hypothetical protein